jgi:hypothetical protein
MTNSIKRRQLLRRWRRLLALAYCTAVVTLCAILPAVRSVLSWGYLPGTTEDFAEAFVRTYQLLPRLFLGLVVVVGVPIAFSCGRTRSGIAVWAALIFTLLIWLWWVFR